MFNMAKKTDNVPLSQVVQQNIDSIDHNKYLEDLTKITRSLIKAIIGKTHEYTFEESLFILREEGYLSEQDYETLKRDLLKLAFLKYSPSSKDTIKYLDEIKDNISRMLPRLTPKSHEDQAVEIYKREIDKDTSDQAMKNRQKSRQYKEEILKTEREINREFEHVPKIQSTQVNLQVPFAEFFETAAGFKLEKQIEQNFQEPELKHHIWDLYAKYYLLQGRTHAQIKAIFAGYDVDDDTAQKYLNENDQYLDTVKRFLYMEDIVVITVRATLQILLNVSVDDIIKELTEKGYKKEHVIFVLTNILMDHS